MDISKAKALPGVVDIVTWEDPELKALQVGGGMWSSPAPLLDNIADQEDAEVAVIVVAESEDLCDEALRLIKVDWDVKPHILDPRDGIKPDAPVHTLASECQGQRRGGRQQIEGDIEAGFKQADQIIEFDFVLPPYASHIPNPSGSMAYWYDDRYERRGAKPVDRGRNPGSWRRLPPSMSCLPTR